MYSVSWVVGTSGITVIVANNGAFFLGVLVNNLMIPLVGEVFWVVTETSVNGKWG